MIYIKIIGLFKERDLDMLHFANSSWWYVFIPLTVAVIFFRYFLYKPLTYRYSLVSFIKKSTKFVLLPAYFFLALRFALFGLLLFLVGKPQLVDSKSSIKVEGVDIMMVLDASGSMAGYDDPREMKTRFNNAQQEAIKFIDKRENDQIGYIVFGTYAVVRCPLTLDHDMVKNLITESEPGMMGSSTSLFQGILIAAKSLQYSQSKSKIIIALTDGNPDEQDMKNKDAILEIVKKFGITLYAIGIGKSDMVYMNHPLYGMVQAFSGKANMQLLHAMTAQVGGKAFAAQDARELEQVYDMINKLEKSEYETTLYQRYIDYFMPYLVCALGIALVELFCSSFIWLLL